MRGRGFRSKGHVIMKKVGRGGAWWLIEGEWNGGSGWEGEGHVHVRKDLPTCRCKYVWERGWRRRQGGLQPPQPVSTCKALLFAATPLPVTP